MRKSLCLLCGLFFAVSAYSKEVKGGIGCFDIPDGVEFLSRGNNTFIFNWGGASHHSILNLSLIGSPIPATMIDMVVAKLSEAYKDELKREGSTNIKQSKRKIEVGDFKGAQICFKIKNKQGKDKLQYFLFLSDGKICWLAQFETSAEAELAKAVAIIKSAKVTGDVKAAVVVGSDDNSSAKSESEFKIPSDAPSQADYCKKYHAFLRKHVLVPYEKTSPGEKAIRYVDEVLNFMTISMDRVALSKLLREGKELLQERPDDIVVRFAYGVALHRDHQYDESTRVLGKGFSKIRSEKPISNVFDYLYAVVLWQTSDKSDLSTRGWGDWISFLRAAVNNGELEAEDSRFLFCLYDSYGYVLPKTINVFQTREKEFSWLINMLRGVFEVRRAWDSRGNGWASSVTKDGWKGFHDHLEQAKKYFTEAWRAHPERPEASAEMIEVAMAGRTRHGEGIAFWFNRAVKAEIDYAGAYTKILWALMPRWGGSHRLMYELGKLCVETGRFDTYTPTYFLWALFSIIGDQDGALRFAIFRKQETKELCDKLFDGMLAEHPGPELRNRLIASRVLCELYGGRYKEAGEHLKGLDKDFCFSPITSRYDMHCHRSQLEIEIRAGMTDPVKMNEAYDLFYQGDVKGAKKKMLEVLGEIDPKDEPARQFVISEIGMMLLDKDLRNTYSDMEDGTGLGCSVLYGRSDVFNYLLSLGADVNVVTLEYHTVPLHQAAYKGRLEMMKTLLKRGADVNAQDYELRTPLHFAAAHSENLYIIKCLLEHGANPNIRTKYNELPLHWAAHYNHDVVFNFFVDNAKDIDARGWNGSSLLCDEVYKGNLARVKLLLAKGADINFQNNDGNTPLLLAYKNGRKNVVEYLKANGADITIKNKKGQSYQSLVDKEKKKNQGGTQNLKDIEDEFLNP